MDQLKVYFDPRCPWCYQTSRWAWRLEDLGLVELDWGLYSLELANLPDGKDPVEIGNTGHSAPALRSAVMLRRRKDSQTMGRFYHALGIRAWETEPPMDMMQAVRDAIVEVGFEPTLLDEALADPSTWLEVMEDHQSFVQARRPIGVPSIVAGGDGGPLLFGPVIYALPSDEDAAAMWKHLSWLIRYPNFAELKRRRGRPDPNGTVGQPDLPGWRYPVSERTFGNKIWVSEDHPLNV